MNVMRRRCENRKCGQMFTPKHRSGRVLTRFCCPKCWHVERVRLGINVNPQQAQEARRDQARRITARNFGNLFGALSEREIGIIREALRIGFNRGYKSGWARALREGRAA